MKWGVGYGLMTDILFISHVHYTQECLGVLWANWVQSKRNVQQTKT